MNLNETPNGGWAYHQSQTGWNLPTPVAWTHGQACDMIIKHRRANPAVTARHNLSLDPAVVSAELVAYTETRLGIASPKSPAPALRQSLSGAALNAVDSVKKLAAGNALLMEWQESGEPPVDAAVAFKRAEICAGCPMNDAAGLTRFFTVPVAERIRKQLSKLHDMNLTTPSDDHLFVCQACLCPLHLKVWTPLNLILKRLKPEQKAGLDERCWIRHES